MKRPQPRYAVFLPLACAVITMDAAAQGAYPSRNVQVIVPYTAGGSIDLYSRALSQRLAKAWGRNVVVDNRPGASGMIGTEIAAKADPDGHVLLGHTSSYPATAAVRAKLSFDPAKAIVPVATLAKAPMLLAIHPSVPAKSVKELVALAKKNPGKLNYGSSGAGGNNHFSGGLFATAAGVKMIHIPYKGISMAVTALASGEVEIVIASAAALMPQVKAGRLRALGVTSLEPSPLIPGLPAIAQSGVPGYSYELWWGIFAPAGMPADRVNLVNAAVNKILATDDMKKFLSAEGAAPWPQEPAQIADLLPREIARYKKAAQVAGIPPQ
ncbi:MAG: tripartite tricarboxylate transporter substrate binding protein [Betaproteobacteria bacterium]|nr:tripartite tricarboxylate transporter substrate binding protein [Betaproteobacteria bacterium]MBI2508827.1 tripartite tricarboxylate transporter substrate binding protein [Betaproteobacteria bacterium]